MYYLYLQKVVAVCLTEEKRLVLTWCSVREVKREGKGVKENKQKKEREFVLVCPKREKETGGD
jgi:hypothetical protein